MRIPDRAHSRIHPWVGSHHAGSMLYDLSSKNWQNMRGSGVFDPNSTSPQFRRLDYEKEVKKTDAVTRSVVGSMLKRASRQKEPSEKEGTNRPD
jgi:hypothetical protein